MKCILKHDIDSEPADIIISNKCYVKNDLPILRFTLKENWYIEKDLLDCINDYEHVSNIYVNSSKDKKYSVLDVYIKN